jgi:hypothetical protein
MTRRRVEHREVQVISWISRGRVEKPEVVVGEDVEVIVAGRLAFCEQM